MKILKKNKEITNFSNFKTKAFTKYFFEINSLKDVEKIKEINDFAKEEKIKVLFIWWGTNMLFAFEKFDWIIIKNNLNWWKYDEKTQILKTYSNENISDLAEILEKKFKQNLWHRFIGLPWSVWGAVYGNAWCFWLETENNFLRAKVVELETWEIKIFEKNDMNFSYRNSILKQNNSKYFLIEAEFDLSKKVEKYSSTVDNIDFRENKQPKGNTCGSFFKNPNRENSAWFLIENVWLKWKKINWAFFSELHANFLMNDWTAKFSDLIYLIDLAQKKVKEKFWIELVWEVRIIKK